MLVMLRTASCRHFTCISIAYQIVPLGVSRKKVKIIGAAKRLVANINDGNGPIIACK